MKKTNVTKDLLINIKNGYNRKNTFAYCKLNNFCVEILWVLYKEELINGFAINKENSIIEIKLKYFKNAPLLTDITLISKPSLINYLKYYNLNNYSKKFDYLFLSTAYGVLSSRTITQNKISVGGQLLFGLKLNV